ncbi:hypothetical protein XaC1_77 [Xanthomonas phage XaC1]|nr:hypothetical protein XaC1_77 [Xanthomonas phage XaC1]
MNSSEEYTIDVVLKLIQKSSTLPRSWYTELEQHGKLCLHSSNYGTRINCSILISSVWHTLFYLLKNTDSEHLYMKENPTRYADILLYSSDNPNDYFLLEDTMSKCSTEEALDYSYHFNLNLENRGLMSRSIKIAQKFRETEEEQVLLSNKGYQLLLYSFPDSITSDIVKILEEGVLRK